MSLSHAPITKAFDTVKHRHTVVTFAAQPFHWGETEEDEAERTAGGKKGNRNTEGKRVKQRVSENNTGKKQVWENKQQKVFGPLLLVPRKREEQRRRNREEARK